MATTSSSSAVGHAILEAYGPPREEPQKLSSKNRQALSAKKTTGETMATDAPLSETPQQTPEQAALRGVCGTTGGMEPRDRLPFIAVLAAEWAAGTMPLSRQEQVVAQSCILAQRWERDLHQENVGLQNKGLAPVKMSEFRHQALAALWELSASILSGPQASSLGWNRPVHSPSTVFVSTRVHTPSDHTTTTLQASKGRNNLARWVLSSHSTPLREALANKLPERSTLLGPDPFRALLSECLPSTGYQNSAMPYKQFQRGVDYFGLATSRAPSKSNTAPLLDLAIQAFGGASKEDAPQWAALLAQADTLPFFRFDHSKAIWRAAHPLWALASANNHHTRDLDLAPIVAAFLRMGYRSDGSFPAGRGAAESSEAHLFSKKAPNALWAFCLCEHPPSRMNALLTSLVADGADPRSIASDPLHPDRGTCALMAAINRRALASPPPVLVAMTDAFETLVGLGIDPLEALPPRSLQDAAPGRIRELLQARLEREDLMRSLSEQDMAEALLLLKEKREAQRSLDATSSATSFSPVTRRSRL